LRSAKAAYTTRHVDLHAASQLLTGVRPRVGDLVLARVAVLGQHPKIELAHGRRAAMFPGDEIVVAYGNRYAPDQFEAEIPGDLGPCDLVAAGGVAGKVIAAHGSPIPFLRKGSRDELHEATGARKLPALKLADGTVLTNSKAILDWIDKQHFS